MHKQKYQVVGHEFKELELTERSQVLREDFSIAHDILVQDFHVFHGHVERNLTKCSSISFSDLSKTKNNTDLNSNFE